jgi:chromosome segregation ATPase
MALSQGTSADMTHRALTLHNSLRSLSDERSLALTLTMASSSVTRKELALRGKLEQSVMELKDMALKYQNMEVDRDNLSNSFQDQRLAYERRLEWTRSEAHMSTRNISEIHVNERKQAEQQCYQENELRVKAEQANEQLTRQTSSDKLRINELEKQLEFECKSRQDFESAFESCKHELRTTSEELERTSNAHQDLQERLLVSEEKVSALSALNEDATANLEGTCEKLIQLATIYQIKESEMDRYKAEVRSTVDTHNRQFDAAIQKYESAKQSSKAWSKKYEEANKELKELKAHKADIQRMRKHAPVAYLNQLHNDPRIREKKQSRRQNTGKENARR